MSETEDNRRKNLFPPGVSASPEKVFTSENQPSGEQKSLGWKRKRTLKELLDLKLTGKGKGSSEQRREEILSYLGLPEDLEITIEEILHLKMLTLSLKKNDNVAVNAYEKLLNRAHGMPKQRIETEGITAIKIIRDSGNQIEPTAPEAAAGDEGGEAV